jgi:uncharacterized membrane-anchored protein YhcB (DUF1043 family)
MMSEENTELDNAPQVEAEQVETPEEQSPEQAEQSPELSPELSPEESDARSKGWTDKETWVESGKNPDDWVNYKHFNRVGSLISEVRNSSRQHRGDIENLQKFQKLQLEQMKVQLEGQRKEAVSLADEDAFADADNQLNNINQQLNDIDNQVAQSAEALAAQENEWVARNSWSTDTSESTVAQRKIAQTIMQQNPNLRGYDLTDLIDSEVAKLQAPKTNPNRERPSPTSKAKPAPQKAEAVTLDSMTAQEKSMVNAMRNHNPKMTDADVLRLLKNSRG